MSRKQTQRLEQLACREFYKMAQVTRLPASPELKASPKVSDYVYHIPNGGQRAAIEAAIMVGQGVKPGVSDFHVPLARRNFIGLWLEAKKPLNAFATYNEARAAVSEEQQDYLDRMRWAGHATVVCYGWMELYVCTWYYLGLSPLAHLIREVAEERDRVNATPLFVRDKEGGIAYMTWGEPRYQITVHPNLANPQGA